MGILLLTPVAAPSPPATLGTDGTVLPYPLGTTRRVSRWSTNILKTWSGREQRIAQMDTPRERYEADLLLLTDDENRNVRALMFRHPASVYLLPLRHEALTVQAPVTGVGVSIDTTYSDWISPGRRVLVEAPGGAYYYTGIVQTMIPATPGPTVLTLDVAPSVAFPAGSQLMPLFAVNLEDQQAMGRFAVNAGRIPLAVRGLDPLPGIAVGPAIATFDSLPVLDRRPLNNTLTQERELAALEFLDRGAVYQVAWSRDQADFLRTFSFTYRTAAERQFWKRFFLTVRGQQKPFLLPTWRSDFPDGFSIVGTTITFAETASFNYVADWFPSLAHKRVMAHRQDGTFTYAKVNSATDLGSTQSMVTSVDLSVGSPVVALSFLETVRLSGDEIEFQHDGLVTRHTISAVVIQEV